MFPPELSRPRSRHGPAIFTGPPNFSAPVVTSSACRKNGVPICPCRPLHHEIHGVRTRIDHRSRQNAHIGINARYIALVDGWPQRASMPESLRRCRRSCVRVEGIDAIVLRHHKNHVVRAAGNVESAAYTRAARRPDHPPDKPAACRTWIEFTFEGVKLTSSRYCPSRASSL